MDIGEAGMSDPPTSRRPPSFAEVKKLKMHGLRSLCGEHRIAHSGRVTKQDLVDLVCDFFGLSTSGESLPRLESSETPAMPEEIREAYKRLPSFTRITSGWSVASLCMMPHYTLEDVHEYLLNSPDKDYDGCSLRAYKQLRAYQLYDERHIHDVELNLWENGSDFLFIRAKCWPWQDTS